MLTFEQMREILGEAVVNMARSYDDDVFVQTTRDSFSASFNATIAKRASVAFDFDGQSVAIKFDCIESDKSFIRETVTTNVEQYDIDDFKTLVKRRITFFQESLMLMSFRNR